MGRRAKGWSLYWDNRCDPPIAFVRFRWGKTQNTPSKRYVITTGKSDSGEAHKEAARIYSEVIAGRWGRTVASGRGLPSLDIADLTSKWLVAYELAHPNSETHKTWESYAREWIATFGATLDGIDDDSLLSWRNDRLSKVVRETHRKERTAVRNFLDWLVEKKHVAREDLPALPELPKNKHGVRANPRRKTEAVDLSPEEFEKMLAMMPEYTRTRSSRTKDKVSVRDFATVQYETTLRPRTIQRLRRGINYDTGWASLRITSDIDKIGYGRDIKLTGRCQEALDRQVARAEPGEPIFGVHDIRGYYRAAAKAAAIPPEKAARVSRYDLRHAGGTHIVEAGGDILGAAYTLGHKQATTTNRYLKITKRLGDRGLELREKASLLGCNSGWPSSTGELLRCEEKETPRTAFPVEASKGSLPPWSSAVRMTPSLDEQGADPNQHKNQCPANGDRGVVPRQVPQNRVESKPNGLAQPGSDIVAAERAFRALSWWHFAKQMRRAA